MRHPHKQLARFDPLYVELGYRQFCNVLLLNDWVLYPQHSLKAINLKQSLMQTHF